MLFKRSEPEMSNDTEEINVSVTLPFVVDIRKEPRILENLKSMIKQSILEIKDYKERMKISIPILGDLVIKFNKIPIQENHNTFHISFKFPYEESGSVIDKGKNYMFYQISTLPDVAWSDYWNRIYLDEELKERSLNYFLLMNNLRKFDVSQMTLAQHKLIIFYGPPGTGKTTLARGLANRVAEEFNYIGMGNTIYVELNAHRLSSEELGRSQQLIQEAFTQVKELSLHGHPVVCLIDEVESLLTNRAMTLTNANPADVFKSVNAVLQEIDSLANRPNVFLLATSNLPKAIDRAFFDRADMLFFIDLPNKENRRKIFYDIFSELNNSIHTDVSIDNFLPDNLNEQSIELLENTKGFSGRQLRKFVAEAMTLNRSIASNPNELNLSHLNRVISISKNRLATDRRHGGVYDYEYDEIKEDEKNE